jgi:hypothetical protein
VLQSLCCVALSSAIALLLPASTLLAQRALPRTGVVADAPRRALQSVRPASRLTIDGRLDEAAWASAGVASDFVQHYPDVQRAATHPTEARILIDDGALYVAMRLTDPAPDSIIAPLARRDYSDYSDWAQVIVDSYHDRRTAFRFALNPAGIQRDALLTGDREFTEDLGWDAVWSGAAARDSAGWTAEFRIPLSQLRFSVADSGATTWGVQFGRHLARRNERSYWAPIRPELGSFVSQFGTLEGIRMSAPPRRMEVVPFSVAQMTRPAFEAGNPLFRRQESRATLGADFKIGISDFTLTGTINPDFGQVEADPSEVNLSGVESFFSERRPFFLEGSSLFAFNMSEAAWLTGREALFYSRRIGRAPQGDVPDEAEWSEAPSAARVLAALKLSGRTRGGWSIAAASALTDASRASWVDAAGRGHESVVEPRTHYGVVRASRDFREGDGAIGTIVTTVHRDDAVPTLRSSAIVGGIDARLRFGGRRYGISGNLLASQVRGSTEAMIRTQRGIAHLYQRPDADYLGVDSSRTSLNGMMSEIRIGKNGGGHTRWGLVGKVVTPGFEVNDLGLMPRADALTTAGWLGWDGYKASRFVRSWESWFNAWAGWTMGREQKLLGQSMYSRVSLHNFWNIESTIEHHAAALNVAALRGGPALRTPSRVDGSVRLTSDARRVIVASLDARGGRSLGDDDGASLSLTPELRARVGLRTQLAMAPSLSWWRNPQQYVATVEDQDGDRYVAGDLLQSSASLTLRASHAFSPNLTLQLYAQPFLSAGEYSRLGEVVSARASSRDTRIHDFEGIEVTGDDVRATTPAGTLTFERPDYTFAELRSNAVLRWQYRPGSALFLVWSQERAHDGEATGFEPAPQARALLKREGTNVFLVKVSHWLGR